MDEHPTATTATGQEAMSATRQSGGGDESVLALKRSLDQRFEELGKLTHMLASCEKELEAANKELLSHRIELQAMKSSLSWRATAGLRGIGRLLRRWSDFGRDDDIALLKESDFFDSAWYLNRYPDVSLRGVDPARHYLEIGAKEGRNPGPEFDTNWYLQRNPDVAQAGINPLVHFIRHGQAEWRLPKP